MLANKIIIDLYSTSGGKMKKEDYKKFYNENDMVFIALLDKKVCTYVHREEMFEKGMNYGCFIENIPQETPQRVQAMSIAYIKRYRLQEVSNEEFIKLEKENETERVGKAFSVAEEMIAND